MSKGFTIELNHLALRQLDRAAIVALGKTAEALHTEVVQAQVVPRDTGWLQNSSFSVDLSEVSKGTARLVLSTPYARRLYFHPEYHFHKDKNPNARGRWFDDWLPGGSKQGFAAKAFAAFYRKESGGVIE